MNTRLETVVIIVLRDWVLKVKSNEMNEDFEKLSCHTEQA
jgi:hypothetical protein